MTTEGSILLSQELAPEGCASPSKRNLSVETELACLKVESPSKEEVLELRRRHLGPNLPLFFESAPLHIVRGSGSELFDPAGTSYLDCINNVSHVGHCHPEVAAAVARQLFQLNTNSRYLHENLSAYAEVLQGTMPNPLEVVYMVVSGSEANDLAWRMACCKTRASGATELLHVVAMDNAYHGHTSFCHDISAYKHTGAGGRPTYVHMLPCPDPYRGLHLDGGAAAREAIARAHEAGGRVAAFFCESIISCGGQVVLPGGFLDAVYAEMRAEGALCIADEVQCGFGRAGRAFWAFELQGVVPDIVTCGKPMGNGYPCAAVVTSRQVAEQFAMSGGDFFATFGGSTGAATAGLAVMKVIRDEGLQENALAVGRYCMARLRELQEAHPDVIGDVRGEGLMIGVEIITDAASKTHNPAAASFIKEHCCASHHVLLSAEGPFSNVLKIKPPLCFSPTDVDRMVGALAEVMEGQLTPKVRQVLAAESRREMLCLQEA